MLCLCLLFWGKPRVLLGKYCMSEELADRPRRQGEPSCRCEEESPVYWFLSVSLTGLRLAWSSKRVRFCWGAQEDEQLAKKKIVKFEMLLNINSKSYCNDDVIIAKRPANYFYPVCFESCDTLLLSSCYTRATATIVMGNIQGIPPWRDKAILIKALKWPFEQISTIHELGSSELPVACSSSQGWEWCGGCTEVLKHSEDVTVQSGGSGHQSLVRG